MESILTLQFVDGSKLAFDFPLDPGETVAALPRHAIVGARIRP
jgi:hypothetical protein